MQRNIRLTIVLLVACSYVRAQNVALPYSIYGIGAIQTSAFNRTTGMASTGIAYRSDNNIIQNNPASYTALTPQIFHIEGSARWQISTFTNALYSSQTGASQVSNDFAVDRLAFATKINKWWGASLGFLPYTTMSYSFQTTQALGASGEQADISYDGSGGLHKVYFGNGFALGKQLSIGADANFIFGGLQQNETIVAATANADLVSQRNLYLRNATFDFGAQYHTYFDAEKKWQLVIGATWSPSQKLFAEDSISVSQAVGSTYNEIDNGLLDRNHFNLPQTYGGGLGLTKETLTHRLTFLADYHHEDWTQMGYYGNGYQLTNSNRYSAGLEIVKKSNIFNNSIEHVYFQAGGYYQKSYLTLDGYPVIEWGGSIGVGVNPLRYPRWGWNVAMEAGQSGNYETGALKEDFFRLTLTIHYFDVWFTHGRKVN